MHEMDDRELPAHGTVYRTMGLGSPWSRIGCGIMDKSGVREDHADYRAPTWSLILVLRGRGGYLDADGRRWELGAGDCFLRLPSRRHTTVIDPRSRWLEAFLDCSPALWKELSAMRVLAEEPPVWRWGLARERVARFTALRDDLARAADDQLPALLVRLLSLALEAMPAEPAARADPVAEAAQAMADGAAERFDLRAWCRRRGHDYERFRKRFQRRMGISLGQYRIRRRMELACALLQSTDRTIVAIAAELGYRSPYAFSGQFRAHMGVSPARYRARGATGASARVAAPPPLA
jgi:AraC family transcriptional regulator of arabinose operon